ncbi:HesB/IscA family protein [Thermoactinospora rubra]|uniref:HesB/IscA family protein n=1 Tax=Thermoactinospora rubra TaxID=1088767 RepID=UPI000A0FA335|nr:iron-sulfur cluster biosynthesis family protein [Thermoactinospora rubra]
MLTLTPNAAQAIRDLTAGSPQPGNSGIRISANTQDAASLVLSIADGPEPADQVVEHEGARVYLDQTAAAVLEDKQLDAGSDARGSVSFTLSEQ